ncbi:MAG: hypothetical protein ABGY41_19110 [Candidatus Poribacteria bacterium]
MLRGDLHVVAGVVLALLGVSVGPAWVAFLCGASAVVALYGAARVRGGSGIRRALLGGLVAGAIVATGDAVFIEARWLFHLRRDVPFLQFSVGVEACRAALIAAMLYLYTRLRMQLPKSAAVPIGAVVGAGLGLAFEHLGVRAGLWDWNASLMPDLQIGAAWAFVPLGWAITSLCLWYCLMGFRRGIPLAFHPIGIGIRYGAAYLGFTIISYALLLRVYGKVVMP